MEKEKIIDRIKKLLMLGENNSSEAESQSAILKAQELMAFHGLDMNELETGIGGTENEIKDINLCGYKKLEFWHIDLSTVISDNFKCFLYLSNDGNGLQSIKFVGTIQDLEVAKEVYYFALESIEYFKTLYVINYRLENRGIRDYQPVENLYINGYIRGLKDKLTEQVENNNWSLVVVTPKEVNDYVKGLSLKSSKVQRVKMTKDEKVYSDGYHEGRKFEMGRKKLEA